MRSALVLIGLAFAAMVSATWLAAGENGPEQPGLPKAAVAQPGRGQKAPQSSTAVSDKASTPAKPAVGKGAVNRSFGFTPEELAAMGLGDLASGAAKRKASGQKDNPLAGCLQCHVNVEPSHLAGAHCTIAKMGCTACHGRSEKHVGNENNDVKPDEVFARKDINRLCGDCHDCGREIPAGFAAIPRGKRPVCIDCHPAHAFPAIAKH